MCKPMFRCAGPLKILAISPLTASQLSVWTSPHDGDANIDPLLTTLLGLRSQHRHSLPKATDQPNFSYYPVCFTLKGSERPYSEMWAKQHLMTTPLGRGA